MPRKKSKKQLNLPFKTLRNQKLETMLAELEKEEEKLLPQTELKQVIKEVRQNIINECRDKGYSEGDYRVGDFNLEWKPEYEKKVTIVDEKHTDVKREPIFSFTRDGIKKGE